MSPWDRGFWNSVWKLLVPESGDVSLKVRVLGKGSLYVDDVETATMWDSFFHPM